MGGAYSFLEKVVFTVGTDIDDRKESECLHVRITKLANIKPAKCYGGAALVSYLIVVYS